jgi:hypothetical protein
MSWIKRRLVTTRMWLMLGVVTVFFVLMYPVNLKYAQSFRFVDEEEHMVIGWLLTRGYALYEDVSMNHQPMNYVFSWLVHNFTEPANVFMLLQRHRQAIYLFNLAWALVLVFRYGGRMLPVIVIYELTKFALLGNQLLAESLVVYPFCYVLGSILELTFIKQVFREDAFLGVLSVLLVLTLLPLVLPLILLALGRYVIYRVKFWKEFLLGGLITILAVFVFIDPADYWRETWVNNFLFAVPRLNQLSGLADYLRLLTYPLNWFTQKPGWLEWWVMGIMVIWITTLASFMKKWLWKRVGLIGGLWIIWISTNVRVPEAGVAIYKGFHLLPWWIAGITVTIYLMGQLFRLNRRAALALSAIIVLLSGYLTFTISSPVRAQINPQEQNYISYTPPVEAAEAINELKRPGDTLIVVPNQTIIHWLTQLEPTSNQVTYYEWQYYPPEQRAAFEAMLTEQLPTFIQFTDDDSAFAKRLRPIIAEYYTLVFFDPNVYMFGEAFEELDDELKNKYDLNIESKNEN